MPSSEGANIPRWRGLARGVRTIIHSLGLVALIALVALLGLGDTASGGEEGAIAAIAIRPAAARLLAEARLAPVVQRGAGFTFEARMHVTKSTRFHAAARGMTVRLPPDAAGRIELGVAGEARRVGVRRAFAGGAPGRLVNGALVYDAAAPGIDAVWFARGDDAEELLVVRAGAAAIAYDLDLPEGSTLIAPEGFPGLVEVRDARGSAWLRMTADAAWDARGRPVPIAVRVRGSRVWIDVPADAERPLVVDPTWSGAGRMAFGRAGHTATLLGSGQVLIAGGRDDDPNKGQTAEIYDPATGRFTASVALVKAARSRHTATLLRTGQVLLVGGLDDVDERRTAELFDPVSATFLAARSLPAARAQHTATLLHDGRVLVVGGDVGKLPISAETYGDATGIFTATSPTAQPRLRHTATPLADGRVLLLGGLGGMSAQSTEIFDPSPSSFIAGKVALAAPRAGHTATLLRDGQVLIAGGDGQQTAEIFDPAGHDAPSTMKMSVARASHTATLLPSGKVLLVGGSGPAGQSAELFDPALRTFKTIEPPQHPRFGGQTATLLPSGAVLIVGGYASEDNQLIGADVEIFDPHTDAYPETAATMAAPRVHHTATRLHSGKVLIVGGVLNAKEVSAAELYDRGTDRFDPAGGGSFDNRIDHTATLLPTGEVLIAGGTDAMSAVLGTAAIYDPAADRFQPTPVEMLLRRTHHAATPLPSGVVLITGGSDDKGNTTSRCEVFDPAKGTFDEVGTMTTARALHTATLLPSGEVLIVGGTSSLGGSTKTSDDLGTAELYDPITKEFRPTGALTGPFPPAGASTATLLPSGEVLILGVGTPQLYDPAAGVFRVNAGASGSAPWLVGHTATLLPSGRVLIAGGSIDKAPFLPSPLIYTPASGEIIATLSDGLTARSFATATLLATGEVLIAGGDNSQSVKLASARRWSEAPDAVFRPQITGVRASVIGGEATTITGDWGALGPDTGGGSSSSSASNYPVAVWMPWTGGAVVGRISAWTPGAAIWTAPSAGLVGRGLLFVSAGGAVSAGVDILVLPGVACTSNLDCGTGQACSAEGRCVDPVNPGLPAAGCGMARAGSTGEAPMIALLLGIAAISLRRAGRGAPTARGRAGRCSRRRRARRAPSRPPA